MMLRAQVGRLLVQLRGETPAKAVAGQLGATRPYLHSLEKGSVSLDKLDEIGAVYGVRFELVAYDAATGHPVAGQAQLRESVPP